MNSAKLQKPWLWLVLANLFVFALVGLAIVQDRQRTLQEAQNVAENYSHTLEGNFSGFIRRVDLALLATMDEIERQHRSGHLDTATLKQFMERQHSRVPDIVGLRVSDAQGTIRWATGSVAQANASIADMPHFQAARTLKAGPSEGVPLFSEPLVGRVSHLRVINILRPYRNPDGSFAGVVLAGIEIDQLSVMLRSIELGPYGVDSVWTRRQLIARNTKNDFLDAKGEPPKPVPLLQALIESNAAKTVYHTTATVDGIRRLVSARKIADYPLYLAVGLADRDFLARWQQDALHLALVAAVFTLGSTLLMWLVVRSQRRSVHLNTRLLDQETRFRSVFDNANDGIVIIEDGVFVECNARAAEILGMRREQLLGKSPDELSPLVQPDGQTSQQAAQRVMQAAMAGEPQRFEWQHLCEDGSTKDVEVSLNHLALGEGNYLQAVMRDVSARKQADRHLLELNQRLVHERSLLKTLINTIPELVWLKDMQGCYLACNPAFEKFFGRPEAEIVGKTDFDFVDADLAQMFRANDMAALQAASVSYNEEWITYASDGHRALVLTAKTPMVGADGVVTGVLGIAHDITEQRRTEEALELHQRNLQKMVDERTVALNALNQKLLSTQFAMECVGIGIHWVDVETGRFLSVNQKAAEMIGYEVHEMLQLRVMDVDPNFPQAEYDRIKEVIRSQKHITIETSQRARNGTEVPLEVSIYYHEGADGMPPQFISFQTDITQRKAAEQALISAKQQAEAANERSSSLVQELEVANRQLQLNDLRLSAMLALSQLAPTLQEPEILQRGIDEAVRLTGSHIGYLHVVNEDQETLDYQAWSGSTQQYCAAGQTGHFPISQAGVWADTLRFGRAVVHNEFPTMVTSPDFPQGHIPLMRHLGVPVIDAGKVRLLVGVGNKASNYEASDLHNLQVISNDLWAIFQRRHTEIELAKAKVSAEAATVAKSAFLANMSHEIRTPLNAITGMTHLIRRSGISAEQNERLKKIELAGEHLLEIINSVLDLSKIEAGKFTLEEIHLDVGAIVGNVVSILCHQAQAKKLSIVVDNQLAGSSYLGDPTRLQQCLLNFGSNAIKFSNQGQVTIHVHMLESDEISSLIRFEVEDQGIGVDPVTLERLFSAFEQADSSTTRQHGGTGLGLAITRKLAQLMGGDAGAVSQPGSGSRFWFSARLRNSAYEIVSSTPVPGVPAETVLAREYADRRLLLVEDDSFNQEIALLLLQDIWPVVDLAEDGLQAVEMVKSKQYDLILMDMQMPHMDGLEATRQIRKLPHAATVPVIAMTANAFIEDRTRCFAAGMNDFLSKPVNPMNLYEVILKWMRR